MNTLPFPTRADAGTALARELARAPVPADAIVLALVRGGVVVGAALAQELQLPLHPYIVRKLGHPAHREYALGAIAEGGATYLDEQAMRASGVSQQELAPVMAEETAELRRRVKEYIVTPRPALQGRTVILTDDGAATGATLFAAIADLRNAGVGRIVVALPVCPPDTAAALRDRADAVHVLHTPASFSAVGQWYDEFPQVEDAEVLRLLQEGVRTS